MIITIWIIEHITLLALHQNIQSSFNITFSKFVEDKCETTKYCSNTIKTQLFALI